MENNFFNENSVAQNSLIDEVSSNKKTVKTGSAYKAPFAVVEAYKNIRIRLMSILEKSTD